MGAPPRTAPAPPRRGAHSGVGARAPARARAPLWGACPSAPGYGQAEGRAAAARDLGRCATWSTSLERRRTPSWTSLSLRRAPRLVNQRAHRFERRDGDERSVGERDLAGGL